VCVIRMCDLKKNKIICVLDYMKMYPYFKVCYVMDNSSSANTRVGE